MCSGIEKHTNGNNNQTAKSGIYFYTFFFKIDNSNEPKLGGVEIVCVYYFFLDFFSRFERTNNQS